MASLSSEAKSIREDKEWLKVMIGANLQASLRGIDELRRLILELVDHIEYNKGRRKKRAKNPHT